MTDNETNYNSLENALVESHDRLGATDTPKPSQPSPVTRSVASSCVLSRLQLRAQSCAQSRLISSSVVRPVAYSRDQQLPGRLATTSNHRINSAATRGSHALPKNDGKQSRGTKKSRTIYQPQNHPRIIQFSPKCPAAIEGNSATSGATSSRPTIAVLGP
ncbi:hypothetical protein CRG98_008982 [Punica granatum]|uniref:Uncharacterized protein n=1 Tax=Punica granatum TaxID=22663 RepID=A0A2I0KQN9_PUNGR|nr:hypothetical protein CRG98_008982 [Punica granatum]